MSAKKVARRKAKPSQPVAATTDATPLYSAAVLLGIIETAYEKTDNIALAEALFGVCESVRRWVLVAEDERDLSLHVYEALSVLGTLSLFAESPDWESVVGEYCDPIWNLIRIAKRLLEEAQVDPFQQPELPESAQEAV